MANRKLHCAQPRHEPGGGGINVSRAINRLGGYSIAIYTTGGENGRRLKRLLDDEGIENHPVLISGMTRENFMVYDEFNGQQYWFGMPGPVLTEIELKHLVEKIVPGDIMILESGDLVTADIRLLKASKLQVNESVLTGESVPVSKHGDPVREDMPLAERWDMLYKGTAVTRGSGEGIALATGMDTEIGVIASLVQEAREEKDPLEKRLNQLGRKLVWVVIVVAIVAGGIGIISGKELFLMIKTTIALVVAAIPEGLPIIATVALTRGMHRMARRNALVRRLSSVQTLGRHIGNRKCTGARGSS